MTLEIASRISSIVSALASIIGLVGLGTLVYKFVWKQDNNNPVIVRGDMNVNGDVVTGGVSVSPRFSKNNYEQ